MRTKTNNLPPFGLSAVDERIPEALRYVKLNHFRHDDLPQITSPAAGIEAIEGPKRSAEERLVNC
jgi:hypothetical protein